MDRSRVVELLNVHTGPLREFLGLSDWRVNWNVQSIAGDESMVCDTSAHIYHLATVTVDDRAYDDEADLLDGIFHELCHVLHASFQHYRQICEALHPGINDQVVRVEQRAWSHAAEGFVLRMEWLWRNHLRTLYHEAREQAARKDRVASNARLETLREDEPASNGKAPRSLHRTTRRNGG